ncbi:unnamed protein product [Leptosia nina]|uniref:Protein SON n=1 Tax=Leptosia nina TaxID=320188 RepID=A0AAV1K2R5_9NEOP
MTSLIDKIEQLIKREKTTPDRKKDDTKKSSNEILSELFSAFNADPPKLEDIAIKKVKKSKKKHKKEKKKRSRSSSCSDSDGDRKRKKRKKSKSKKHRDARSTSTQRKPVKVTLEYKPIIKEEPTVTNEPRPKEHKHKSLERVPDQKKHHKYEHSMSPPLESFDASLIPMPDSPKDGKGVASDLRHKLDKKSDLENDKNKSKIQIKNLKFSAVFEETVKKAEEEARKKAEKVEDGEYSDTSSSTDRDDGSYSQFPKSSDPGGILKKAAQDVLLDIEEKSKKNKTNSINKSSDHYGSESRKRSDSNKRSRSRSGSRHHRHRSRSRSRRRSHSKSSRSRRRSESKSRRKSRSRSRHRSTSRSRHWPRHTSPRHRGRRSPTGVKLADSEKKRLLEVARRNAINMLKNGAVPAGAAVLPPHTRSQVMAAIQSGGKSVDELTDFCKHLSKKEALGELSSVSSNDGESENEDTIAFHHPFLVKEKAPIVLNIRGGAPLPLKSNTLPIANKDELRLQFPVSSGSQHREKASEWVPVSPKKDNMQLVKVNTQPDKPQLGFDPINKTAEPLALPAPPAPPSYMKSFTTGSQLTSVPALMPPGPQAMPDNHPAVDMAAIVSQKLSLIRKEQEQNELCSTRGFGWSASDLSSTTSLGQFTGSTGANILTPRELASGSQAWAKKDQLVRAAPVEGGMGMHLLQKMGWCPGQGLGKEGTGTLQPLLLEVKLDTRGLQAKEEMKQNRLGRRGPAPLIAGGKHPVSLLGEYCSKQKLGPPEYNLCFECGPDHKKNFLFRVKVAGVEYQPAVASANKKQAKADAAQLALQKLGIVT